MTFTLDTLDNAARSIIQAAGTQKILLFHGQMGAGKTTLIKALCTALGTDENISSPTFSIVNEYLLPKGKIYHFDFYRLKNQTEALDMGYEEYFYSGEYCFIEWPEKIPDILPDNYVKIVIKVMDNGLRQITLDKV